MADKLTEAVERLREVVVRWDKLGEFTMGSTFAATGEQMRHAALDLIAALTPAGEDELEIAAKAAFVASGSPGEYRCEAGYWRDIMREVFTALGSAS